MWVDYAEGTQMTKAKRSFKTSFLQIFTQVKCHLTLRSE